MRPSLLRPAVLFALALLAACHESPPPFRGTAVPDVEWGKDFTLTSHRGERVDTATLHGRVQVLFFGFTHCPDICAPTLAKLAAANKALGDDRRHVQVLFVTVDPDHDTPQQLAKFLPAFDASFIGLTGKASELMAVARDHKVYAEGSAGTIVHSGNLLVKDARGRLRLVIPESATVDDVVHDLRLLLRG
jgi:protein SCO1/2